MLNNIIKAKTVQWLASDDCSIQGLVEYIRQKGELRDTQIQAIETYLFLKIAGDNKPLWQLFAEGFFSNNDQTSKYYLEYPDACNFIKSHTNAKALFNFATQKNDKKMLLPELADLILKTPDKIDYDKIIKSIFYHVSYADYLMSLPMGAGKTFLMAAIIYLDLYFADNEPANRNFAHNFLVLIPSGLKSSIVPSLKTIEKFDPSWVLPEPAAGKIKQLLKFDILDQAKTAKKSNKAQNPNAQKVNHCLPDPFGQVFVVNAEKVILNRTYLNEQLKKEQQTSIEELNRLKQKTTQETVDRFSRLEYLNLPKIEFYQLQITYNSLDEEERANTTVKLQYLLDNINEYKISALIKTSELRDIDDAAIEVIEQTGASFASFNQWIFDIAKASYGKITIAELDKFQTELKAIFGKITFTEDNITCFNELFDLYQINSQIRIAFSVRRYLQTESEVLKNSADLLIIDNLKAVEQNEKLFPNENETKKILDLDQRNATVTVDTDAVKKLYQLQCDSAKGTALEQLLPSFDDFKAQFNFSTAVKNKDKTFHYLPYDFSQSGFEKEILQKYRPVQ